MRDEFLKIVGVNVSLENVINRVEEIVLLLSQEKVASLNYMELWVLSNLFPEHLKQASEFVYCSPRLDSEAVTTLSIDQVKVWVQKLILKEEIEDKLLLSKMAKRVFGLHYALSTLEGFRKDEAFVIQDEQPVAKPTTATAPNNKQARREKIIAEATHVESTADGSLVIEQKDGVKVRLKSKLSALNQRHSMESTTADTTEIEGLALKMEQDDQRAQILTGQGAYEPPREAAIVEEVADRTYMQAVEFVNESSDFVTAFFGHDSYKIYHDEIYQLTYLSLADLLLFIFSGVDPQEVREKLYTTDHQIRPEPLKPLLESIRHALARGTYRPDEIRIGEYKHIAFHEKESGKRILHTLIEVGLGELHEQYASHIVEGKLLQKYHPNTISQKYRVTDILKPKS